MCGITGIIILKLTLKYEFQNKSSLPGIQTHDLMFAIATTIKLFICGKLLPLLYLQPTTECKLNNALTCGDKTWSMGACC